MDLRCLMLTLRIGPTDGQALRRLIDETAAAGFNTLVIELGEGFRYASEPRVGAAWALGAGQLTPILDHARRQGLDVVPLVPCLTHCRHVLRAAGTKGLGETSLYDPEHAGNLRVMRNLLGEACDVFRPRWLHVGFDEPLSHYDPRRRLRLFREASVFAEHVAWACDQVRARGCRPMMWADALLDPVLFSDACFFQSGCYGGSPDRLSQCAALLPRNVLMCDWHYEPAREYPTIRWLAEQGFDVVGASRFPRNSYLFTRYARATATPRWRGMMMTVWNLLSAANVAKLKPIVRRTGRVFQHPGEPVDPWMQALDRAARPLDPIPPGPFDLDLSLLGDRRGAYVSDGWAELRYMEYPDHNDAELAGRSDPGALQIKPTRAGQVSYTFASAADACFDDVTLRLWLTNPGWCVVEVGVCPEAGPTAWQPVLANQPCRGQPLDLAPLLRGRRRWRLRISAENHGSRRSSLLTRLRVAGCVVSTAS